MALAAKVAAAMGNTGAAQQTLSKLDSMAQRDGAIGEVYAPREGLPPKKTLFYASEQPFSWGSAFVLDALAALGGSVDRPRQA